MERERGEYYAPNGAIESCNAVDLPLRSEPTPKHGVAVWPTSALCLHKKKSEAGDKRDPVAGQPVWNLHPTQCPRVELVVKGEIHIDRHGQRPVCVTLHESVHIMSKR